MASHSLLIHLLTSAVLLTSGINSVNGQGRAISEKLWQFANDGLGVHDFQNYLDDHVTFKSSDLDGGQLAKEVAESMGTRLKIQIDALTDMAKDISKAYSRMQTTNPFPDCCDVRLDEDSDILKIKVNNRKLCTTGQGLDQGSPEFLPADILDTIMTQYKKALGIKYAYYGSEEGVMFNYPSVRTCNKHYDPRFRPWYVEASTSQQKDIVIVIDKSGSMEDIHRGKKLMTIAIEAASTVINTLNPNDRVGVVAFSGDAKTPPGKSDTSTCYSKHLAVASAQNKDYLNTYVSYLQEGGATYYIRALNKAFDYFTETVDGDNGHDRAKVILFLTDGKPTDSKPEDILNLIANRNRALNNSVIILTYGLGRDVGSDILHDMANQIQNDRSHGETKRGLYTAVENPDNLRVEMGSYYDLFKQEGVPQIIFTVPFVDAFGSGLTEALCLPVNYLGELKGVACMEISVDDMLAEITYFQEVEKAYAFIVDGYARVLTHPLFSQPQDITNNPFFTYLQSLEAVEGINDITRTEWGNLTTQVKRINSRGDVTMDGVDTYTIDAQYSWNRIQETGFTICLVIPDGSSRATIDWKDSYPTYLYHRLDLVRNAPDICRQFSRVAVKERPMLFFAARAFEKPFEYLYTPETTNDLDRYETYLTGSNDVNPGFREDIRNTVAATSVFEEIIMERGTYNLYSVWRYTGMENGVHRTYPASETPKNYDPTKRTWYLKAKAHRSNVVMTTPYEDAFGAGTVVTLSHVLYEGKPSSKHVPEDPIIGVMGMDFTLTYFYYLVTEGAPQCDTYSCFIIDNSGFVIVHKDWITSGQIGSEVENIHITMLETGIANDMISNSLMIDESCVNIESVNNQYYWRVQLPFRSNGKYSGSTYDIEEIHNTNIFIITVKRGSTARCHCGGLSGSLQRCYSFSSYPCFCPCYNTATVYKYCEGEFEFTQDGRSQCAPPIPKVNFADVAEMDKFVVPSLSPCFNYNCMDSDINTDRECNAIVGCSWCKLDQTGDNLHSPYCNTTQFCPQGQQVPASEDDITDQLEKIVGAVLGCVGMVAIFRAIFFLCKRRNKMKKTPTSRPATRGFKATPPVRSVADGLDNVAMTNENKRNTQRAQQEDPDYMHLH